MIEETLHLSRAIPLGTANGEYHWFDSSAEALRDERSLPVYVDGWLRGIHQQHNREKELD